MLACDPRAERRGITAPGRRKQGQLTRFLPQTAPRSGPRWGTWPLAHGPPPGPMLGGIRVRFIVAKATVALLRLHHLPRDLPADHHPARPPRLPPDGTDRALSRTESDIGSTTNPSRATPHPAARPRAAVRRPGPAGAGAWECSPCMSPWSPRTATATDCRPRPSHSARQHHRRPQRPAHACRRTAILWKDHVSPTHFPSTKYGADTRPSITASVTESVPVIGHPSTNTMPPDR